MINVKVAALLLILLLLVLACAYIEWQRYKLRRELEKLSGAERGRLASEDLEVRFSRPAFQGKSYILTMLAGQMGVNVPIPLVFGTPLWLVQRWLDPNEYPLENLLAVAAVFLQLGFGGRLAFQSGAGGPSGIGICRPKKYSGEESRECFFGTSMIGRRRPHAELSRATVRVAAPYLRSW